MDLHTIITLLLPLAGVACVAGFIDTIAGGGGLITVPVLMLYQLPPVALLATNKLQASAGTFTSTLTLWRKKQLHLRSLKVPFCLAFLGSVAGTLLIQRITPHFLMIVVPIVLAMIALYFLFAPAAGKIECAPRISETLYNRTIIPLIGFYDGFFGPGTGSFFSLAEVACRGRQLVKATANAKAFNLASNIASLLIFIVSGKVIWMIGLAMLVGQLVGAYFGSLTIIGGGAAFIRPLIVIMYLCMLGRYLWMNA